MMAVRAIVSHGRRPFSGGSGARRTSGDHWYAASSGQPCYTIPSARNPQTEVVPTLRDARKRGLVPSVTTILGIVNRPGLEAWRTQQLFQTLQEAQEELVAAPPPNPTADPAASAALTIDTNAVMGRWKQRITQAASRGSDIHNLLEQHLLVRRARDKRSRSSVRTSNSVPPPSPSWSWLSSKLVSTAPTHADAPPVPPKWPSDLVPLRDTVDQWLDEYVHSIDEVELSFASVFGYGGKIDLLCTLKDGSRCICDFKTQLARKNSRFQLHDVWPVQLVAYAVGVGLPDARLINLCLDTGTPGVSTLKEWSVPQNPPSLSATNTKNGNGKTRLRQRSHLEPGQEDAQRESDHEDDDKADDGSTQPDVRPDANPLEINGMYWESFRLAFLLWSSPLGRNFVPVREVPGCKPIATWDDLVHGRI